MSATAVVLTGGRGARLTPLTRYRPKTLLPVANRTILDHILKLLSLSRVIEKAYVVSSYMCDAIDSHLRSSGGGKVDVKLVKAQALDTADAVRRISSWLSDDFIVVMGDVVTNCDIASLWHAHRDGGAEVTVALEDGEALRYYEVRENPEGEGNPYLVGPLEKSSSHAEGRIAECPARGSAGIGVFALSYRVLDVLDENPYLVDFSRHLIPFLMNGGYRVYGWYADNVYSVDVNTPTDYMEANKGVMAGLAIPLQPLGTPSMGIWMSSVGELNGTLRPPSVLGKGVVIGEGSVLGPFTAVGDGTEVSEGAVVINSVIMANAKIGAGAVIVNSIIGSEAEVGDGAQVFRCILEDGASTRARVRAFSKTIFASSLASGHRGP